MHHPTTGHRHPHLTLTRGCSVCRRYDLKSKKGEDSESFDDTLLLPIEKNKVEHMKAYLGVRPNRHCWLLLLFGEQNRFIHSPLAAILQSRQGVVQRAGAEEARGKLSRAYRIPAQ